MSDMSFRPSRKESYGYEPDKWTHPALEVPGLWAGHESRVVVPPQQSRGCPALFFQHPCV